MSAVAAGNSWDTEVFTDRADLIRLAGRNESQPFDPWRKNPSGQADPVETVMLEDVPCKIQRIGKAEDIAEASAQVIQTVRVLFPFAVALSVGDLIQPRFPSAGNRIRVGSYEYSTMLECGRVVGVEVT